MEIESSSLHQDTATLTVERYMVEEEMAAIGQEHERQLIALLVAPPAFSINGWSPLYSDYCKEGNSVRPVSE